jgi:hypothetical protein
MWWFCFSLAIVSSKIAFNHEINDTLPLMYCG